MECEFNEQKAINAVLYAVKNLKRSDFHKIFKILYFSDREMLSQCGFVITGDTYIAMHDGPVPSKLYDIFKAVRGDGYFKDERFSEYIGVKDWDIIYAKKDPDINKLSRMDLEILDSVLAKYGDLSWDELKEKSHDYAWRNTTPNRPIEFEKIMIEAGCDDDFIRFVLEDMMVSKYLSDQFA